MEAKVVLITGASSGIGGAAAVAFREAGYRVFGSSRSVEARAEPDGTQWLQLDVTSDTSVQAGVASVLAAAGRIDVLVNNAGYTVVGAAEESSSTQARAIFDTNVFGTIRTISAVLPHMRDRGAGRIINVSSVLGFLPAPYMALYAATKHAVHGYSLSLDHEVREFGVRVSVVEPAYTATRFGANAAGIDQPIDVYARRRTAMQSLLTELTAKADTPQSVAATILAAAERNVPRLRVPSGASAQRLAIYARFMPKALLDRGIRRASRLP